VSRHGRRIFSEKIGENDRKTPIKEINIHILWEILKISGKIAAFGV